MSPPGSRCVEQSGGHKRRTHVLSCNLLSTYQHTRMLSARDARGQNAHIHTSAQCRLSNITASMRIDCCMCSPISICTAGSWAQGGLTMGMMRPQVGAEAKLTK
jgi:hypothetical protein